MTVKARVVWNGKKNGKGALQVHFRHLLRDGVGNKVRRLVAIKSSAKVLEMDELNYLVKERSGGRHHFRFIILSERRSELNLTVFAEQLVAALERRLDTKLSCFAVEKCNTGKYPVRDSRSFKMRANRSRKMGV